MGDLFVQITAKHFIKFQRGLYMKVGLLQTDYRTTISLFRSLTWMSQWVHISEWLAREMPIVMCVLDAAASPAHGSPIPYANWVPQPSTHLLIFSFGHMPVSQHTLYITTTGSMQLRATPRILWAESGHILGTLSEHSGSTQSASREHSEGIQRTRRNWCDSGEWGYLSETLLMWPWWKLSSDESVLAMNVF